ncbi:MAG: diguanylate cyclase [Dokdonella sp.]|uniref:diguanylate cyclase n=1 Tax=Dokdonella sp. TaxID=2291710 RepID=UPI003263A8BF
MALVLWALACSSAGAERAPPAIAGPTQTLETQLRWMPWRRDASREGLPRNWVSALAQDREGFMFAGTEEGLARYDGQHWTPLPLPLDASTRQPYINALAASGDGSIWIGTDTAGLFVHRSGALERRVLSGPAATRDIKSIVDDPNRGTWIGTDNGIFLCVAGRCSEIEAARGLRTRRILPTHDANGDLLYVGTSDAGVFRIDDPYGMPRRSAWRLTGKEGLPDDTIGALIEWDGAAGKDLWVGTAHGVARLGGDGLVVYAAESGFPAGASAFVRMPHGDGAESLIAALPVGGLAEFDEDGHWRLTTTANGLPENAVNTVMLSDPGQPSPVVWLGSAHNGVLRGEPRMWSAFTQRNGLPNNVVHSIGEANFLDGKNTLWMGTADGSVRWDRGAWRPWLPSDYAHRQVFEVIRDADRLWIATRKGLLQWSRKGVREFTTANSDLPDNAVIGMHLQTGANVPSTLWLATGHGLAAMRGDRLQREPVPDGKTDFFVRVVRGTLDAAGKTTLWAGAEQGLFYQQSGSWRELECRTFPHTAVFDLRERGTPGHDHALWVASFDGVMRVDLDHDFSCTPLTLPKSAHVASIYQLQFDRRDRMYLFGAYGVMRLPADYPARGGSSIEYFDLADGLPDLEFTRASLLDSQGRVWGGTGEGATMYDPSAERVPSAPHPLRLLAAKDEQSGRTLREGVDLDVSASNIAFDLGLLSYQRDDRTRYRSQLLGLDDAPGDWTESGHRSYSRLPAGHYAFRAWARAADGVESGPVVWSFRVHAPWWRRSWAFVLFGIVLVLLGLVVGRLRERLRAHALAQQAHELEREVGERTRELAEANRLLEHASLTDPLTGLWNRRYLGIELPPECDRAIRRVVRKEPAADLIFLLADVDHFKHINDAYSHAAGDAVLVELARRIRALLRTGDIAVRWGGEEFLVVLRDAERANAQALAQRLQQAVGAAPFSVQGTDIPVTCSIGWAAFPFAPGAPSLHSADEAITFADAALYRAKHGGRNRVVGAVANCNDTGVGLDFVDAPNNAERSEPPRR